MVFKGLCFLSLFAIFHCAMIKKVFKTSWRNEGVGAKVMRAIGVSELEDLDPFLMLDFFKVKLPAGFPDHPHRGFETVTYMVEGNINHEDFKGNKGTIGPGGVQWMTAGKGILHAEMPSSFDEYSLGFQLWINLPKEKKLMDPRYQEYTKEQLKSYKDDLIKVIVIAGEYKGVSSQIKPESTTHFYDVILQPKSTFEHLIPEGWNALVYPYTDSPFSINDQKIESHHACVLKGSGSETFKVSNSCDEKQAKFIIIYGKPLNEPISKYGPFVMNTQSEIQQTFNDFKQGKNGFENADIWESEVRHLANK